MSDDSTRLRIDGRQTPRPVPTAARRWEAEKADLEQAVEYWRARARLAESEREHLREHVRDLRAR